jgi:hypothetical protein
MMLCIYFKTHLLPLIGLKRPGDPDIIQVGRQAHIKTNVFHCNDTVPSLGLVNPVFRYAPLAN